MRRYSSLSPRFYALLVAVAVVLVSPGPSESFDDRVTHPLLTRQGITLSTLDSFLVQDLALASGVNTLVERGSGARRPIRIWLEAGSELEDAPPCRARNHFHNPLRPFASSGVTDLPAFVRGACADTPFAVTRSNVLWGTRFVSPVEKGPGAGNPFDWDAARLAFREALIGGAPGEREAALARTFETLGHVAHLIQDLAVPAHVRNDFQAHLQYLNPFAGYGRWTENGLERIVRRNPQLVTQAAPAATTLTIDFSGRPLTRFWDPDLYTGATPSRDTAQGLAEYTNANFASPYTILTDAFPESDPKSQHAQGGPTR